MKKRTAAITLAVLGAIAMSTGCSEQKEPTSYATIQECTQDGNSFDTCTKAQNEAKAETEKNAPKFASQEQCQAQFSNCQQSSSGGWFMPALMGYMVGNMMSNGSRQVATPIYYDRDRRPQAAGFVGGVYRPIPAAPTYTARAAARASAARASASTGSRSSGGFGSRAGGSFGG